MIKKTFSGKYKEKKQFNKKKFLKLFRFFILCCLIVFLLTIGYFYIKNENKSIEQLYQEENYTKIVELYDKKSDILTNSENENLKIAKSLTNVKRYDDSIKLYEDILSTYKMNSIQKTKILAEYVEPVIKKGDKDKAFEILDVAIPWAEADLDLLRNLKRIYGFLVASNPTEENIVQGITYLHDYVSTDYDKEDWEANYYLSLLLYYAGNYDDAITYAVNTLKINRDAIKAKHLIPQIYYEASEYDKAIEALKSLNKVEINNVDNYLLMGKCYEILKDWKNVEKTYKKVLEFDAQNENANMGLVRCYTMQHNTQALTIQLYKIKDLDYSDENKEIINILLKQIVPTLTVDKPNLDFEKIK